MQPSLDALPSSCPARNCIPNQLPSHTDADINASKSGLFQKSKCMIWSRPRGAEPFPEAVAFAGAAQRRHRIAKFFCNVLKTRGRPKSKGGKGWVKSFLSRAEVSLRQGNTTSSVLSVCFLHLLPSASSRWAGIPALFILNVVRMSASI